MLNIPEKELEILKFWQDKEIFKKTLGKDAPQGNFVFYEGPPTANGKPGIHHVEARAFKDLIPRFKTMNGFRVERRAGWDTHGLPVELEVEKKLGLKNKKDVEAYGVKEFNEKCKESVWQYVGDWEKMTERVAFWVDMEHPYVTYHNEYIESLWWIIKQVYERGLMYQGYKVVPQCPRCGTALSSHEVAQGYKNVKEDSVYIKFKLKDKPNEYILAWTTTPWTLPGNVALAVGENIDYVLIENKEIKEKYILAKDLIAKVLGENWPESFTLVQDKISGKDLVGLEYEPLFPGVVTEQHTNYQNAFKVYAADFVSTEDGTGVVHTAVMYGADDYELGEKIGLPKVHSVNLDGTFNELVPQWQGRFVKDVEPEIIADLKVRNILFKTENYAHDYPFCWRCDTPLIYYAKDAWFFQMSTLHDQLIKNNEGINWEPAHIKEGRFGEWLREAKDWGISRERYWGTPIPVWRCSACQEIKVVGSFEELEKLSGQKIVDPHRPFIDEVTIKCEKCGGVMKRTPEVIDCWFDSGAMPFSQLHYPFENKELIDSGAYYPAEFISEAIDQTRGWFYTLLAVATLLGKRAPYKNVICLGHILDKNGQKMSKHIGNVVNPWEMFEKYGADAVRWYLYTVNQPGEAKRFDEQLLKESTRTFTTLLNVLSFYQMYAQQETKQDELRNILDKWIVAKLNSLIKAVSDSWNHYDIFTGARQIRDFIEELSTWYLRRSRERFKGDDEADKNSALSTLHYVLLELSKLLAPATPFLAEYLYQELKGEQESVHLDVWPLAKEELIDQKVLTQMNSVRQVVELGLAERAEAGIKIRQPLGKLKIRNSKLKINEEYLDLLKDELNIKEVEQVEGEGELTVELDTTLNDELKEEGIVRELIRTINNIRKEMKLTIQDRIKISYRAEDELLNKVFEKYGEELKKGTLADSLEASVEELEKVKVNESEVGIKINKIIN
ncbi:MAG TPA: isoleucine--tRNA ligase [bacterium]|nr:isoleucine--tRNA ligase [bacterium]